MDLHTDPATRTARLDAELKGGPPVRLHFSPQDLRGLIRDVRGGWISRHTAADGREVYAVPDGDLVHLSRLDHPKGPHDGLPALHLKWFQRALLELTTGRRWAAAPEQP